MKESEISRKGFLKSGLGFMGIAFVPGLLSTQGVLSQEKNNETMTLTKENYILKNVLLETGFEYEDDEVIRTKTGLFCVTISNGKIKNRSIIPTIPMP